MKITRYLITAALCACFAGAHAQVFHLSSRLIPAAGGRANVVYLLDATGTLTGQYNQVAGAVTDAWGYRDGAVDRANNVYFGWGGGVARHNADGSGGTQIIFGTTPGTGTTWRALAFDPTGNAGAGSFWTQSFGSDLIETTMGGALLNQFPNNMSVYGLAYDDATGNLWAHTRGTLPTDPPFVAEVDTNTGLPTGTQWQSDFGQNPSPGFSFPLQGGLSGYRAGGYTLAGVLQGSPDTGFTADIAGNLTGPFAPNPRDFDGQTGNNGHLGIAAPIPEPASMIALGLGLAALVARRRRKKAA
ncbi:MAG: PEP-CTERM sorting domain-containing protein [Armatimonadetes bacterium]|nr:PEP-CTERM sorting domain-containing protein [Armatimonadota bacterium]